MTDRQSPAAADLVVLRGITKSFGSSVVNDKVNLTLHRGEVHALLGENGAGKTTLTNILSGFYQPDDGEIILWGERVSFRSPKDALSRGIGMVHQEFQLIDAFTVTDNILLGQRRLGFQLPRTATARALTMLARENGLAIAPERHVWQLTVGERQRVEILRLLYLGAELLILDEPTAVLTPKEAEDLYVALRRLAKSGKTVIFITHKLKEVMSAADRITVLRQGKVVATVSKSETSLESLADLMIGKDRLAQNISTLPRPELDRPPILRLTNLSAVNPSGHVGLRNVSCLLRGGEILGIVGVAGNGQSVLADVVAGLIPPTSGTIEVDGCDATRADPLAMMRAGVRYVPEDRTRVGLVPELSLADNLILRDYRNEPYSKGVFIDRQAARKRLSELVTQLNIQMLGLEASAGKLSGGNQQKLLLGRELYGKPKLLVVAQPTRGLDLEATATVRRWLIELRNAGVGVLLVSEDLDEIFEISDKISVIYAGEVTTPVPTRMADWASIGLLMGGSHSQRRDA
jgi:simple sugar transport system ATP-binding protein